MVVINNGAHAAEGALEIIGAERNAIMVHRLGQPDAAAAASSPITLRLPAYDVNVFVVERLHR